MAKRRKHHETIAELERSLRYMSVIIKQKGREILNDYNITPPQFVALQWLFDLGEMTIGDLSSKMYLACSTTTDLIDRMEKTGLVTRAKDEQDRRIVRVVLLERGKKLIEEVIAKRQNYLAEVVCEYDRAEVELLCENLQKLHKEMSSE
ncbi:MarR family winged helix-turn-helix transcriptional regulator [Priestia filamentosa]|uniref:MarR family transcriptional regulator n=1 Tax=Priestia filamentosa TaxID=1402861 RepID=A0A1X7CTG3_9BACI|nr:MarR family transcriptional regulator [Priestia filamentosa]AKO94328.1 MarR family transcriptional regulator [Priestia filamentosa]MDT3764609.1 MarR family transcriptional regulator [Priestia filamentosa]OXS70944.1 MarR family transcriptional regulator [Priestia filamentosa]WCM15214.1 MarR family transcriptional regulator [Priestia filamentosa]WRU94949.1 MarR family transcriptional regulator [Priestia filamentosa]